jgi:hypothetical protein
MSKNESARIYNLGDDSLMQKGDSLVGTMQRDADDFITRNVDNARFNEIAILSTAFKNFQIDQELLGPVTTDTEAKYATELVLRQKFSTIRSMATTKFDNNDKYKTFDSVELSSLSNEDFFRTSKRVARVGNGFLADLASEGLTALILTDVTSLATTLDINMYTRDIKTQEIIELGNNLWNAMAKHANKGKSIFEFTDQARYNDYVLIDAATTITALKPPMV